jgi:ABC-type sugar transport system permease subunit
VGKKLKTGRRVPYEVRRQRTGYVFILPWILGFIFFFLNPLVESIRFSFSNVKASPTGFAVEYVGFANYAFMLLKDASFPQYLWTATVNMAVEVPIITMFSLFIAIILNQNFRGRTVYRAIYFMPVILTSGVVFTMLSGVMGSQSLSATQNAYFQSTGLMNVLLEGNVPAALVNWITNVVDRIFSLTLKSGVQILLFISGLQKIPASSYEACRIEGATNWDSFWKITFPLIMPMMMLNIVYSIIDSFTAYGTEQAGNVVMAYIYRTGFGKNMMFGYSSAMSWIYFIIIIIFLLIGQLLVGRKASKIES